MIVIDASIAVACLIGATGFETLLHQISAEDRVAAPTLIEYEVGSALRRLCIAGKLTEARAAQAFNAMADFQWELHDAHDLAQRMWALRNNISFYDASYVALAEQLNVPLFTSDKRLAAAPGHSARIICLSQ